jgi:hypothetical protein
MLEKRQEKIHVFFFFEPVYIGLDYTAIGRRIASFKEELMRRRREKNPAIDGYGG